MAAQTKTHGSMSSRWAEFRLIPRIDTDPWTVSFAQTTQGKAALLMAFGCGILVFIREPLVWLALMLGLTLITFMPARRRLILAVTPIGLVVLQTFQKPLLLGLNLAVIALGVFLYWCAIRWPKSRFGQRPVAFLLGGFSALILLACAATPQSLPYSVLWDLVGLLASYLWFIAYAVSDRNSQPARDMTLELASFHPVWGFTHTPFPKGAAYLRRIEAQNPEQLAIVQLKGLKLLLWAILLAVFRILWNKFFHDYLRIPTAAQSLAMSVHGTPVAWHLRWESQILCFFEVLLEISVAGHRIIAGCRMAGFNALRNTYRPLSSTTIVEFFNRCYYYYKELIVDFFFYPTFFRYWKRNRRLRIVFATFAAVLFGNLFYHFTRDWQSIRGEGLWNALADYQVLFFYCAALATALSISQLRRQGRKPTGFVRSRLLPIVGVGLFFCLLNIFVPSDENFPLIPHYPLIAHLRYFASLFFIHV